MNIEYKKINSIDEKNYKNILKNYKFSSDDAQALNSMKSVINEYEEKLLEGFYNFIFEFDYAKSFLHNKEILKKHNEGIKQWYQNLFCGKYDELYFHKLYMISEVHVRIGLPAHYVNAAFSYIRGFLKDILIEQKRFDVLKALDKIIDINLDILTITYKEEEQTKLIDEVLFLKNVMEHKNIEPYVQAIYNTNTMEVEKYECLMRLIDPKSSEVKSVFPYLEVSKKVKLYEDMMKIMIEKSLELFSKSSSEFSLNLSYEDISNEKFRSFIYEKVENYSNARNLIFEILETDFIEDFSIVEEFTKKVRKLGCKIAIDDFGSGFSNMENILRLNPEFIKIDGSLIKNIHKSQKSKTIVKNIVNMAKELNAKTVAEFIHCKEVFDITKELGVDYLQGFYLGEPMSLKKV